MARELRFGVGLTTARRLSSVQDFARRAEAMGYDVVHMADHLYTTAPFPMMTAMAMRLMSREPRALATAATT